MDRDRVFIRYDESPPDPARFLDLFLTTGWPETNGIAAPQLEPALRRSWQLVAAYDGDLLVGFGRVVSDGVLYAMIYDMIVRPSHRNRGIGTEILQRLVRRCRTAAIKDIQLFSASGQAEFYRKRGFIERPPDAPGMALAKAVPPQGRLSASEA